MIQFFIGDERMVELGPWITYFIIYSFLGWVWETTFVSIRTRRFVNRGFLRGLFIPIYGYGALLILLIKNLIAQPTGSYTANLLVVVLISILVVTLLEFLTGYFMEKIFHKKWWNYSDRIWNIKGYVCLESSLVWGIFIVVFILFLHPSVSMFLLDLSNQSLFSISLLVLFYLFIDFILSFIDELSSNESIKDTLILHFKKII